MDYKKIENAMKFLSTCFFLLLAVFGLLFLFSFIGHGQDIPDSIGFVVGFLMLGLNIAFCISLGLLASKLGHRWFVWVGLTIITNPIGFVVAYLMMRQRVKETLVIR